MPVLHRLLGCFPVFRQVCGLVGLMYDFWDQMRERGIFWRDIEGKDSVAAAIFEKEPDEIS